MKLTVQTFLTLDGVMQAPGGPEEDPSEAFTHGGWPAPFPDRAVGEFVTELNSHASAFLMRRRSARSCRVTAAVKSAGSSTSKAPATRPGPGPGTHRQ
jgi:hypothetical protein